MSESVIWKAFVVLKSLSVVLCRASDRQTGQSSRSFGHGEALGERSNGPKEKEKKSARALRPHFLRKQTFSNLTMTENIATIMTLLDQEQNAQVALGIIALSPIVFGVEFFLKPSTYGKLHDSKRSYFGPLVSARCAWMLFESPNWVWALIGYWNRNQQAFRLPNMILWLAFLLHYMNRSIVYPLRMSSASQTPVAIFFMAGVYCVVNG
jgi:hypothetical protein